MGSAVAPAASAVRAVVGAYACAALAGISSGSRTDSASNSTAYAPGLAALPDLAAVRGQLGIPFPPDR
ncbi:hypothetical protein GCM10015535_43330 [Streptomyces gelaticus]|uniref:Secreted protein n=1 Tax=Streptomyces gelaticus TaxID=285446 RepID=A0ABQ2W5B6_9ACTN|nr:hypothetical protein GCM10015535_43330 [Streptomyces gelaticus]